MIRVTLTTLIVGHIVWWPVWFVLMSFHGQDGFFIAGIIALAVVFGGRSISTRNRQLAKLTDMGFKKLIFLGQ